jgi:hypothetical protein
MRVWICPAPSSSAADAADAAVHHVRRRHHVGPGLGMAERLLGQHFQRLVVEHVARDRRVDQAVLAVAGVGVERHVGDHAQFRELLLQRLDHARHQTVRVPGFFGKPAS